jgi:cob(I)alamin adenosyltransferase
MASGHLVSVDSISQRLRRLQQILARPKLVTGTADTGPDPAETHLASIDLERIRQVTCELQNRADEMPDDLDAVTARVLLNDYASAVGHLRAAARLAERRVASASAPIEEARRFIRHYEKAQRKADGRS